MKPLLALSLLLNLCLLTALGYLLTRGSEVVTETKEVVVTKTLNPNIGLETRIIALEAELEQERVEHQEDIQAYAQELAEADANIAMLEGAMPREPLLVEGPRGYGKLIGHYQHGLLLFHKKYPKPPAPESEEYVEYMEDRKALNPFFFLYHEDLKRLTRLPESNPDRQAFMASSVGATLQLDDAKQEELNTVFAGAYAQLQEEGLLAENRYYFFSSDRTQERRRKEIEKRAYEQTRALLSGEQLEMFDTSFPENFLFSTKIIFLD